jgi:hypothetical protein
VAPRSAVAGAAQARSCAGAEAEELHTRRRVGGIYLASSSAAMELRVRVSDGRDGGAPLPPTVRPLPLPLARSRLFFLLPPPKAKLCPSKNWSTAVHTIHRRHGILATLLAVHAQMVDQRSSFTKNVLLYLLYNFGIHQF